MPKTDEIATLQDERIDLLFTRRRWIGRGYDDLVLLLDAVERGLAEKVAELKGGEK